MADSTVHALPNGGALGDTDLFYMARNPFLSFADNFNLTGAQIKAAAPVKSVQGRTGSVVLTSPDITAALASDNPNFVQAKLYATTDPTILDTVSIHAHLQVIAASSFGFSQGPLKGGGGGIIGATLQDLSGAVHPDFPCGLTGYGVINAAGTQNSVFAGFFRADLNVAQGAPTGIETDVFNNVTDAVWPLDQGFPVSQAASVGIQSANSGTHAGTIAFRAVDLLAPWLASFYADPPASGNLYGVYIDATSTLGAANPAIFRGTGQTANPILALQTMGALVGTNPVVWHLPASGLESFLVNQRGGVFSNSSVTLAAVPSTFSSANFYGVGTDGAAAFSELDTYSNGSATTASVLALKTARGTGGSPSNVAAGDLVGRVAAKGFSNGTFSGQSGATVDFVYTDPTPATGNGTALAFNTTPNGTFTRAEVGRFSGSGFLNVGPAVEPDALLTVNANTGATVAPPSGVNLHLVGKDATVNEILLDTYGSVGAILARTSGGTLASKSAPGANAQLLNIGGQGWDGSAYGGGAGIVAQAATGFSGTDRSAYMVFKTTPVAGLNALEAIRILAAGNIQFTNASNFSANGAVATVLGSVGPTGAHTTVQKWLTISDGTNTLYIPAF